MSGVLIVGNATKDVYLRLDNRLNKFEVDKNNTTWLDLAFNGSSYPFYARHSVFGGVTVTLEVLSRFGLETEIAGSTMKFENGDLLNLEIPDVYRYILSQDDNIAYFGPSQTKAAKWQTPSDSVDWIYVDRSACISREIADDILNYLDGTTGVKLAIFNCKRTRLATGEIHMQKLKERADLIFVEAEQDACDAAKCVCIGKNFIQYGDSRVDWSLQKRQDMMTHLTTNSIIAASILGAITLGKSVAEALLLARANVENANLDGALNLSRLEEMIVGEDYRVERTNKQEKQDD